jgi:hypothetical protein
MDVSENGREEVNWIQVVMVVTKYLVFVNTVMSIRIP